MECRKHTYTSMDSCMCKILVCLNSVVSVTPYTVRNDSTKETKLGKKPLYTERFDGYIIFWRTICKATLFLIVFLCLSSPNVSIVWYLYSHVFKICKRNFLPITKCYIRGAWTRLLASVTSDRFMYTFK